MHYFLNMNRLIEDFQSGHITAQTDLVKVTNDPLTASGRGLVSVLVPLDLRAASDTTDHQVLLPELEYLNGIRGSALVQIFSIRPASVYGC